MVLTNISDKIVDIKEFYDILDSVHKLIEFSLTFASQETTKSHDNYIISRKLAGQASNVHSVELTGFMLWGK